ncbi:MAG: hemolysin family protein [Acidobacteriota bacterium]|jgi:CBS domain containing-hemolysin-like protein|nr:hemolysin family protein [Acidobacteriota bacterium]
MNLLLLIVLFVLTVLFHMLQAGFRSFSRIALTGYLEDIKRAAKDGPDLVAHYHSVSFTLISFSICLQLGLFAALQEATRAFIPDPLPRALTLILAFVLFFQLGLSTFTHYYREKLLRRLLFLIPVAWALFYFPNRIFRHFLHRRRERHNDDDDDPSDKELEVFFEESTREGVLETEHKEMIASVIEFGDTLVKEIMTPRVDMVYVDLATDLDSLIQVIIESKKSRLPVVSERVDQIEGIILSKDVFPWLKQEAFQIRELMRPPFFVPETMRIPELLREMQRSQQKFAVVVDEFGGVSGVVTMEDIIEEIVGDIRDEYDDDADMIVPEADGFAVRGDTDVFDLAEALKIKIDEEEDYQTVGGLISFRLGRIPDPGDRVQLERFILEVVEVDKNRIQKVRVIRAEE